MIVCDMCDVVVNRRTFCSDKCRVAYHREIEKSEEPQETVIKTPKETFKVKVSNSCKHGSMLGLCMFNCKM